MSTKPGKGSKFSAVFSAHRSPQDASQSESGPIPPADIDKRSLRTKTGKRSDPNYEQVTAYIRKDTYTEVKRKLFVEENGREFSDLVEFLLSEYVRTQKRR